ncbi:FabD/lysophospholipase-like protein [Cucurbitaria berberidis CBS 394.84]|uniref:FabD/lysophospholipase-like protein n=1 Tax=Cucurbitaria berberidis CBS 394.84 TaxID=1168544 RepID=A0A9P4GNN2_9PLEO|nr:FabD/lysophospholipase-like protein [Cucurbitaria berberidis CBS 394.84]KAF1848514.1 FabD/lysophospholipase-like protein [Cucurbitaria berberidis CBS 394.84]
MANSGVRRKDTTKGPPLRILSLDGGGVRGYSMLIILQELMHRAFVETEGRAPKRHEVPKPCDHFDLIAGTGTGGLIAIMLGRLRMDVETCKDVYVRMTRRVFETDKTFAGIPYRSTLFKASKLEEAIMECVREHTIYDDEGNDNHDGLSSSADLRTPMTPGSAMQGRMQRSASNASRYSQIGSTPVSMRMAAMKWGNPHALLYDNREERTKTAVTAVYKGTKKSGSGQIFLRSYDSRKEPPVEPSATIWQAGRATAATQLAFKPIQIGQSVFLDEGSGKYNPAPMALEEAVCNEWPGRDVGVFLSIGTGKRPEGTNNQQHLWWEGFVSGGIGDFAEARRRLIQKIEDCEKTHKEMKDHLAKRHVNPENYYRLNVTVGVGEFGMNEWNALADISTSTRMYLAEKSVQSMTLDSAAKIARIHFAKVRWERAQRGDSPYAGLQAPHKPLSTVPDPSPLAVELPAEELAPEYYSTIHPAYRPPPTQRQPSENDKYLVVSSDEYPQSVNDLPPRHSGELVSPGRRSDEQFSSGRPDSMHSSARLSFEDRLQNGPPRPPKTPLQDGTRPPGSSGSPRLSPPAGSAFSRPPPGAPLPYPDTDGPPPVVNKATKPEYTR